jgi:hypothetical protein
MPLKGEHTETDMIEAGLRKYADRSYPPHCQRDAIFAKALLEILKRLKEIQGDESGSTG